MFATKLLVRLGLGLTFALVPFSAEAASRCVKSIKRVPGKPLRIPPGYRVISKAQAKALPPCACGRPVSAAPAKSLPAPPAPQAALPRPASGDAGSSGMPSGGGFKPAPAPSGPSHNVRWDAPDGSIANSQQRQAIAIGVVAVAVGAAIWMAGREHVAQAKQAEAQADGAPPAPRFDDPADAHAHAVQLALAKARKP